MSHFLSSLASHGTRYCLPLFSPIQTIDFHWFCTLCNIFCSHGFGVYVLIARRPYHLLSIVKENSTVLVFPLIQEFIGFLTIVNFKWWFTSWFFLFYHIETFHIFRKTFSPVHSFFLLHHLWMQCTTRMFNFWIVWVNSPPLPFFNLSGTPCSLETPFNCLFPLLLFLAPVELTRKSEKRHWSMKRCTGMSTHCILASCLYIHEINLVLLMYLWNSHWTSLCFVKFYVILNFIFLFVLLNFMLNLCNSTFVAYLKTWRLLKSSKLSTVLWCSFLYPADILRWNAFSKTFFASECFKTYNRVHVNLQYLIIALVNKSFSTNNIL